MSLTKQEPGKSQLADPKEGAELLEYDVSVCDICGDKGREDKLAICSNCCDGAEHIYCMRVMMNKVPEGNWLCEDCSQQQDSLKENRERLKVPMRISRLRQQHQRFGISGPSKGKRSLELKLRASRFGRSSALHSLAVKRRAWIPAMKQAVKTATTEANSSFPSSSNLHRKSLFCSDSPSDSLGKRTLPAVSQSGKSRLGEVPEVQVGSTSCPEQLEANVEVHPETKTRSIAADVRCEIQRSSLLDQKQITPSQNLKKRKIIFCTDISPSDHQKNDKIPSSSCQPKSGNLLGGFPESKRKAFQETSPHSLSRDPSMNLYKGKMKVDFAVGNLSKDKSADSAPAKSTQKLESESFLTKSKSFNMVETTKLQQALSSVAALRRLKSEASLVGRTNGSDDSLKMIPRSLPCHRPTSSEAKIIKSSEDSKPSHEIERGSTKMQHVQSDSAGPVSASIITQAEKNQEKNGALQFSETFHGRAPMSDHKFAVPEALGNLNAPKEPGSPFVTEEISCENKQPNRNSLAEDNMGTTNSVSYARLDLSHLKPLKKAILSSDYAIPFPYYIWIGSFELKHSDGVQSTCDGIAGHLSSQASPKVVEVIDFLPKCLNLEAAPRSEIWPYQFIQRPPTEYDIALFYFADSLFSYERTYGPLLDLMIKSDLALRGNFDGVELLIFPSNLLPKQSQRWNALYYLWGVFKRKKGRDTETKELPSSVLDPVVSENRPDQENPRTAETNIDDNNPNIKNSTVAK